MDACGEADWTQADYDALYQYLYDNCLIYQWYDSMFAYACREEITVPDSARSAMNAEFVIGALEFPDDWSYFK